MSRTLKCWCGCGDEVTNRFRQGHDARFHGNAKKVARRELKSGDATKGMPGAAVTAFRQEVKTAKAV